MSFNKDAILNPIKKLEEIKPQLFEIYREDYQEKDTRELERRWNNTIFMMDVNPMDEKEFIRKTGIEGYSKRRLLEQEAEYWNYRKVDKSITKDIEQEFATYMKENFKVPQDAAASALWNMDFYAYAIDIEDHSRQKKYALACLDLGMDPITNWDMLRQILMKKEQLREKQNRRRIEETRWGRKMQDKYPMFSTDVLANILYDDENSAFTGLVTTEENEKKTVCYIPMMRYISVPSLDRMVLHELRHVVETTEDKTGLSVFKMPRFDMANEIRTERNAMRDALKVPMIFGRNSDQIQSYYEILMPAAKELTDLEDALNKAAFGEDYGVIEGVLEKDLVALTNTLEEEEKVIQKIRKG